MTYKLIVLLCLIGIVYTPSSAQDIKVLGKNSFEHSGTSYDRYTLRSVMEGNAAALEQYDRYMNVLQNTHRERLGGSLLLIGGGLATYFGIINALGKGADSTLVYTGLAGFVIGSGLVITSLREKQHILDKAIDIYNTNPPDIGMLEPQLDLGLTANGVGVVYQF